MWQKRADKRYCVTHFWCNSSSKIILVYISEFESYCSVILLLQVQLQIETGDAREAIKAELFTTDCGDEFPCPRLVHSVLHTDSHSYITLSVVSILDLST